MRAALAPHKLGKTVAACQTAASGAASCPPALHVVVGRHFLEAHLDEPFSIDDCAALVGVSRRQIERLFRDKLGVTPVKYLSTLRLQHARALLAETEMSVLDVAIACGYGSSAHFSKCFRARFGVSPHRFSHFRKTSKAEAA